MSDVKQDETNTEKPIPRRTGPEDKPSSTVYGQGLSDGGKVKVKGNTLTEGDKGRSLLTGETGCRNGKGLTGSTDLAKQPDNKLYVVMPL